MRAETDDELRQRLLKVYVSASVGPSTYRLVSSIAEGSSGTLLDNIAANVGIVRDFVQLDEQPALPGFDQFEWVLACDRVDRAIRRWLDEEPCS